MRRKDREVKNIDDVFAIVGECKVAHVAMAGEGGEPYVVPLNFGWERDGDGLVMYFHSAREGRKIGILRRNPRVFVEMEVLGDLGGDVDGSPCNCHQNYASVMGSGEMRFVEEAAEKARALDRIIAHTRKREGFAGAYGEPQLNAVCVLSVRLANLTGKRRDS